MAREEGVSFRTFVEWRRNALLAIGDPSPLHRDLDLHLLSTGIREDGLTLQLLRDGLSALACYLVSRPRFESFGWTIGIQNPPLNLFFTGSATERTVVGRAFHGVVRAAAHNIFIAQTTRPFVGVQTSTIEVEGIDIFAMVEEFCRKSDQQPGRYFQEGDSRVAFLLSLPDVDEAWLSEVTSPEAFALEKGADLKLLAEQTVSFRCGCDLDRVARVVAEIYREEPAALFRGEKSVEAECPRCGAQHTVTREKFQAAAAARPAEA